MIVSIGEDTPLTGESSKHCCLQGKTAHNIFENQFIKVLSKHVVTIIIKLTIWFVFEFL